MIPRNNATPTDEVLTVTNEVERRGAAMRCGLMPF